MTSPEDEERRKQSAPERDFPMDLDVDFELSWVFDQIPVVSNPMSPLLFSSSEFPSSPLWVFSDELNNNGDNHGSSGATATSDGALPRNNLRPNDFQRFVSYTDTVTESPTGNEDRRRAAQSLLRPLENPETSFLIKERMTQALRHYKDSTEQHILAQVWAPIKSGGRAVLTTSGQPFVLDSHTNGLHQYRMASVMYMFDADGESDGDLGLPGRVFKQKLPEWSPNVQYYSNKEYPRRGHALNFNIRGTLALPVFEASSQQCIAVLELIMTSQKINYAPDVDKVCKALEAVNLKSSEILDRSKTQIRNEGRQNALAEILEILTVVCERHKLPLAQTWVPCRHRNVLADGGGLKKSCTSFDGSCMGQVCMSTTDTAFYVVDAHIWGFREACAEHHLQKGQGVAGRAFASNNACFCSDITQFSKRDYPLVHYARLFCLTSCLAISLKSTYTGNDDYILEFFLPLNVTESRDEQMLLESLLATMKQHFRSLKVAPVQESGGKISIEIIKLSAGEEPESRLESVRLPPQAFESLPRSCDLSREEKALKHTMEKEPNNELAMLKDGEDVAGGDRNHEAISISKNKDAKKTSERKRGKAEKTISLEVLQQYFAGSLKEAAKSLGVCPTTMKRICRQHGISRWPSRKIKKVNRSLSKLKRVIESVQGAEGALNLAAFGRTPLPGTVGSISWPTDSSPKFKRPEPAKENTEMDTCRVPGAPEQVEAQDQVSRAVGLGHEPIHGQSGFLDVGSNKSKSGSSSREESSGTPISDGSWHASAANDIVTPDDLLVGSSPQHSGEQINLQFPFQDAIDANLLAGCSVPLEPFGGMPIGDAGSSKDLRNLCPTSDALLDEQVPDSFWTHPLSCDLAPWQYLDVPAHTGPHIATQDARSLTIKATYKDDIIRFRFSLASGLVELQQEVAKRLKLEVGTFEIKYLDDDQECVLIACNADLEECVDVSVSSERNIIRLLVNDIMPNLGSSCESSWG